MIFWWHPLPPEWSQKFWLSFWSKHLKMFEEFLPYLNNICYRAIWNFEWEHLPQNVFVFAQSPLGFCEDMPGYSFELFKIYLYYYLISKPLHPFAISFLWPSPLPTGRITWYLNLYLMYILELIDIPIHAYSSFRGKSNFPPKLGLIQRDCLGM